MSDLGALAEALARARGAWRDTEASGAYAVRQHVTAIAVCPGGPGRLTVCEYFDDRNREHDVDVTTALVLLLGEGERVDLGRCQACVERGGGWERMAGAHEAASFRQGPDLPWVDDPDGWKRRPCPECSEPGPPVECEACEGNGNETMSHAKLREHQRAGSELLPRLAREGWSVESGSLSITRQCPDCRGSGKVPGPPQPTGRDLRPWERVVLDAMPRKGGDIDDADGRLPLARRRCGDGSLTEPWWSGDQTSRAALFRHAHAHLSGPDAAGVFHDWCEDGRDPIAFPCPAQGLGLLVTAWLRDELDAHADQLEAAARDALTRAAVKLELARLEGPDADAPIEPLLDRVRAAVSDGSGVVLLYPCEFVASALVLATGARFATHRFSAAVGQAVGIATLVTPARGQH